MKNISNSSLVILPPVASATNASDYLSFDRKGFDQANVFVIVGTHATTTAVITGLKISESDTVTVASNMTDIAALCASNSTSTSAVNSLPAGTIQGLGGALEFQIDLRKRKRYVGLSINTATNATAVVSAMALLSRACESKDSATQKSLPINLASTATVNCMQIVAG